MWVYLHILVVVITLIRVLSRNNLSPITRLSWFMVLILMPVIGVIIYFLFGEVYIARSVNLQHQSMFNKIRLQFPEYFDARHYSHMKMLDKNFGELNQADAERQQVHLTDPKLKNNITPSTTINNLDLKKIGIEKEYLSAFRYATSINGFKITTGNQAELMSDACDARNRLLEDIKNATLEVNILYYIWLNDDTGTNVANALIHAVKRGVKCRAMADGLGSRNMIRSKLWQEMQQAGVDLSVALPFTNMLSTLILSRFDLRNHRKITVIDGKISYCGSQNCADPEFRVKAKYAPWVDILLRFEGPVAAQNQLLFASDWLLSNPQDSLDDFILDTAIIKNGFPAQVWGDGPTERSAATPQLFATLLALAKEKVIISTPYFVPNETVLKAISAAAYRGVHVSIIFPAINDSWIVGAASRSYYRELLMSGVKIYEFNEGLLHAKTLTIDGVVSLIGSSNLDIRSFDLNYENNILLRDEKTSLAIKQRQKVYITKSTQIHLADVDDWSLARRIWNNVIATIGPVL